MALLVVLAVLTLEYNHSYGPIASELNASHHSTIAPIPLIVFLSRGALHLLWFVDDIVADSILWSLFSSLFPSLLMVY